MEGKLIIIIPTPLRTKSKKPSIWRPTYWGAWPEFWWEKVLYNNSGSEEYRIRTTVSKYASPADGSRNVYLRIQIRRKVDYYIVKTREIRTTINSNSYRGKIITMNTPSGNIYLLYPPSFGQMCILIGLAWKLILKKRR